MVAGRVLLSDEDRALLLKVSSLLEELLETLDVLENEEAIEAIKEAEEDVKANIRKPSLKPIFLHSLFNRISFD